MNAPSLFLFVQNGVYVEIFIIIFIIACYFFIRSCLLIQYKTRLRQKKRLGIYLKEANIFSGKGKPLSPKHLQFFKRHVMLLLESLLTEKQLATKQLHPQIITECLQPTARKFARSKQWLKQYIATQCYQVILNGAALDEDHVIQLLQSDVFLVSLHAAELIFQCPTQKSVDALIDTFAEGRSLNRSLCRDVLGKIELPNEKLLNRYIKEKWMAETTKNTIKNQVTTYRKIFCYQLLEICVSEPLSFTSVKTDIHLGHLDLALAAMRYFAKQMTYQDKAVSQLIDVLHDSRWQIKATAAKLLGEMHAAKAKSALTALLKDDERWVRHNAAYALSLLNPNKEHPWNKH